MKKLGSVLSVLVLVISIIAPFWGIRVHALGDFEENGIVYELQENDTYAVIECNSDAEKTIIPSKVNGKEVTKIKSFNNFTGKEVELPGTIKEIGEYAFSSCDSLEELTLPEGIKTIGKAAFFAMSSLKEIHIPSTIEELGERAFCQCGSLESVELPRSLTVIKPETFAFCGNLKTVVIPDTVTKIEIFAFNFCLSLKNIELQNGLETIEMCAFSGSALEEINIPNTVTKIEEHAFGDCKSLGKVVLPENLEVIERETFSNCSRLRKVELPKNLNFIGEMAFCGCNVLKSIKIPDRVNKISKNAFDCCPILEDIDVSRNSNFYVKNSYLYNNENDAIVCVNKDLSEKENMANIAYQKLKDFMIPGISFEELNEKVTNFMQKRGDEETGGKPEVIKNISKKDFDEKARAEGKEVLYRGITEKKYLKDLQENEKAFFGIGNGQCGNGIYMTNDLSYAESCSAGFGIGIFEKEEDPFVMHMYLKDDAKIISNSEIKTIKYIIQSKYLDDLEKGEFGEVSLDDRNNNFSLVDNNGLIAHILGYDAINDLKKYGDERFNCSDNEMVVVNRSKLVVCDEAV